MEAAPPVPPALKRFIWDIQSMVELTDSEREILLIGRDLMARLVASDDWLPTAFASPDPTRHQQFALYADAMERFAVVATVLAGGQVLPIIIDPAWEIMGVLRGAVNLAHFDSTGDEPPTPRGTATILAHGKVKAWTSNRAGALRLGNALGDSLSIVLHVRGGDLAGIARQTVTSKGERGDSDATYANAQGTPAYDIFSIQTRIED